MHVETAYSQSLVPRLTQHPVRRHSIQLVMHPAADQGTDHSADETAHRGGGGDRLLALRRFISPRFRGYAARSCPGAAPSAGPSAGPGAGACTAASPRSRWRRRFMGVVSVWHVDLTPA